MNALRLSRVVMVTATVLVAAAVLSATFGATSAGCSTGTAYVWNCGGPDGGNLGTDVSTNFVCPCPCCIDGPVQGGPFPTGDCPFADGRTDAGEGGPLSCAGQCLPNPPTDWSPPVLVWYGNRLDAPACPLSAPSIGYEGYADPGMAPLACAACSCTPLDGTCGLPATVTASAASCNEDGGASTPFDPPAVWDGGCTTYDAVDAGVGSVTVAPLTMDESGCTPLSTPPASTNDPGWSTYAFDCTTSPVGACANLGETCAPAAPMGFEQCISFLGEGDVDCPSANFNAYTVKHVFYANATDTRACSSCTCASAPGSCSATLSIYADGTCSGAELGAVTVTSQTSGCVTAAGAVVQSKSSGPPTYTPGTCQPSGGVASGTFTPVGPSTFCCLPP